LPLQKQSRELAKQSYTLILNEAWIHQWNLSFLSFICIDYMNEKKFDPQITLAVIAIATSFHSSMTASVAIH